MRRHWLGGWLLLVWPWLASAQWVVQLSGGTTQTLQSEQARLVTDWPTAVVVLYEHKAKLWVLFADQAAAQAALPALRQIQPQAFVREVTAGSYRALSGVVDAAAAVPSAVSAPPERAMKTVVRPPADPVSVPVDGALAWVIQIGTGDLASVKRQADVLQAQGVAAHIVWVGESPKLAWGQFATAAQARLALDQGRAYHPQAFVRQARLGTLQGVAAVAESSRSAVQAPVSLPPQDAVPAPPAPLLPSVSAQPAAEETYRPGRPLDLPRRVPASADRSLLGAEPEPVDWMLSPLYLLPGRSGRADESGTLAMESVLRALMQPDVAPTSSAAQSTASASSKAAPQTSSRQRAEVVRGSHQPSLVRMAQLANAGDWEGALPLALLVLRDTRAQLTAVDRLLLGWVMLQNQQLSAAQGQFEASLDMQRSDEAHYGAGLCRLLQQDLLGAQAHLDKMGQGAQKNHLSGLIAQALSGR